MVGSGDGNVSLIRDSTVTAKGNKQNRHKSVNSGVSTTVKEPTEPCLTEVWSKNTNILAQKMKVNYETKKNPYLWPYIHVVDSIKSI